MTRRALCDTRARVLRDTRARVLRDTRTRVLRDTRTRVLAPLRVVALGLPLLALSAQAQAQPEDDPPDPQPRTGGRTAPEGSRPLADDWKGAVRVLRVPDAGELGTAEARAAAEIFPDATKVWMHVYGIDPRPVEAARRGARKWICSAGCQLTLPDDDGGGDNRADDMLVSIKVQTPAQPLPLSIWRPKEGTPNGELLFDASLLGRRSYRHVCAYPPTKDQAASGEVPPCPDRPATVPTPDSAEMRLGFLWPKTSELASFEFLAITDTCGNAHVQPFQRSFTVPVYHVASGGCGAPDGRVLRVFPSGGWVRVTAFNLDAPAAGNVVSATFRVSVPPLEDLVSDAQPRLLFPDPRIDELSIDCGPVILKAQPGPGGIPRGAPGEDGPPGQTAPPGKALPGQTPPPGKGLPGQRPPPGRRRPGEANPDKGAGTDPPVMRRPRMIPASTPAGQPMAHQGLVIAPEPLFRGNCRIELRGQTKRRLVAPLALRVRIIRTDKPGDNMLLEQPWIVTPSDATFHIPPMDPTRFDGESRLRIEVYADPKSTQGNVILLSDAGRVVRGPETIGDESWTRLIGSVTVHSAPLCGESNFETVEATGSCLRGYFTVPAMLATLQITRAPWVERPLITRKIFSAVGIAFAFDSYDPVERSAFPIAGQIGGFVQDLGDDRLGLLGYVGIAPTIPILGEGGNTTSIGVLGGVGMEYITNTTGPDEGFKPAAFLSIVVQVGQANPAPESNYNSFGSYGGGPPPGMSGGGSY